jgi:hypothetical protein
MHKTANSIDEYVHVIGWSLEEDIRASETALAMVHSRNHLIFFSHGDIQVLL